MCQTGVYERLRDILTGTVQLERHSDRETTLAVHLNRQGVKEVNAGWLALPSEPITLGRLQISQWQPDAQHDQPTQPHLP